MGGGFEGGGGGHEGGEQFLRGVFYYFLSLLLNFLLTLLQQQPLRAILLRQSLPRPTRYLPINLDNIFFCLQHLIFNNFDIGVGVALGEIVGLGFGFFGAEGGGERGAIFSFRFKDILLRFHMNGAIVLLFRFNHSVAGLWQKNIFKQLLDEYFLCWHLLICLKILTIPSNYIILHSLFILFLFLYFLHF